MTNKNQRIHKYINATDRMINGDYSIDIESGTMDDLGVLGANLQNLADVLDKKVYEFRHIHSLTDKINAGMLLPDILNMIYQEFHAIIPYDRIGFSVIEYENGVPWVHAHWSRTEVPKVEIKTGYRAPLAGSSLETIFKTMQPRIINDLEAYQAQKPDSEATQSILREGIRSSLTCPLVVNGNPVGFIFFSSQQPHTYRQVHVYTLQAIAGQLSVIVEKSWFISELAKKQAEIERNNAELRRLNRTKNDFLGMAAHDLRNPIGNIQSVAEMLVDPDWKFSPEEQYQFLRGVIRQTGYMLAILDDLLDITQIESDNFQVRQIVVNVEQLLREVVARHQRIGSHKNSVVELLSWGKGELRADPIRLTQILDNLISNALKYSPPGSTITISSNRRDKDWYFEVRDQGPGIDPAEAELVFKEFTKLSAQPTAGESSTGLGLAIAQRMVLAQNGDIGFYNHDENGGGAAFWFTLPMMTDTAG